MLKLNTYEGYLKHPAGNTISTEEAAQIYKAMVESVERCTVEDKMDFWNDLLKEAMEYSNIRNAWEFMSREERMDADAGRTMKHDAFIMAVNVLARLVEKNNVDASWREALGDNRKRIGDFACFVAYITGISNR